MARAPGIERLEAAAQGFQDLHAGEVEVAPEQHTPGCRFAIEPPTLES